MGLGSALPALLAAERTGASAWAGLSLGRGPPQPRMCTHRGVVPGQHGWDPCLPVPWGREAGAAFGCDGAQSSPKVPGGPLPTPRTPTIPGARVRVQAVPAGAVTHLCPARRDGRPGLWSPGAQAAPRCPPCWEAAPEPDAGCVCARTARGPCGSGCNCATLECVCGAEDPKVDSASVAPGFTSNRRTRHRALWSALAPSSCCLGGRPRSAPCPPQTSRLSSGCEGLGPRVGTGRAVPGVSAEY